MKLELHVHTNYSYDSDTSLLNIVESCIRSKVGAIAVTDHNEIEGALRLKEIAPFKVIIGEEIETKEGEIIGLFLDKLIKPKMSAKKTIEEISKQGGLVYLPHPFDKLTRKTSLKSNLFSEIMGDIDIVEVYNGRTIKDIYNKKAKDLALKYNKIQAIGSDAHTRYELGRNTIEIDNYDTPKEFLRKP